MKRFSCSASIFLLLILFNVSCGSLQPFSYKYKPKKNTTTFLNTYGYTYYLEIPGKWNYLGYDNSSKDYVFKDSLQRKLTLFGGGKGLSGSNSYKLNDSSFVKAFYKWDRDFMVEQEPLLQSVILEEVPGEYLICKLYVDNTQCMHALYGLKREMSIRFCLTTKDSSTTVEPYLLLKIYQSLK